MKKEKFKGFILGVITTTLVLGGAIIGFAEIGYKTLNASYHNISIYVDQKEISPRDANGTLVEPFTVDGTTYLPVRAIGTALGKEVSWDQNTKTVYIGTQPEKTETTAEVAMNLALTNAKTKYTGEYPEIGEYVGILDQNNSAFLIEVSVGDSEGGFIAIYHVVKSTGAIKFVMEAQDYWEGMIDITTGEVLETSTQG